MVFKDVSRILGQYFFDITHHLTNIDFCLNRAAAWVLEESQETKQKWCSSKLESFIFIFIPCIRSTFNLLLELV